MKKGNKGFTLIELLVVIAIIGILAIVAVPALFKNINKAKTAKLESDYNAIKSSFLSTYAEKNEFLDANLGITNEDKGNMMDQLESVPLNNPFGGIYSISTGKQILKTLGNGLYQFDNSENKLVERNASDLIKDNSVYLIIEPAWKSHEGYNGEGKNKIGYETFEKLAKDIGSDMVFSRLNLIKGDISPESNCIYIKLVD